MNDQLPVVHLDPAEVGAKPTLERKVDMVVCTVDGDVVDVRTYAQSTALIGNVKATLTNGDEELTIKIPPNFCNVGDDYEVTIYLEPKDPNV